jgi:lysophospholipase L1-like esterase
MIGRSLILCSFLLCACRPAEAEPQVIALPDAQAKKLRELPLAVQGRAVRKGSDVIRQWPGSYFVTTFVGSGAAFRVGQGDAILHIFVDGKLVHTLVRPAAGAYQVSGLPAGRHKLRIEVANESQKEPTVFSGFYRGPAVTPLGTAPLARQVEFIGDSYTVGYGNTSPRRECTEDEVWETTDTSQSLGPILANRYRADYQVNAISGRGIVRNYGGFEADTLPAAYPFALLEHGATYDDPAWRPQLIVISLGTNDFSTPLKLDEKWRSRAELRDDYEKTYVRFVQKLRVQNPRASFILWATDTAEGEVADETERVVDMLRASGETRVKFLLVPGLSFSGCDYHPSVEDDRQIAEQLAAMIDAQEPFGR